MKVTVELSGGLELLFNNVKVHKLEFNEMSKMPLRTLLIHMRDKVLTGKSDLFMKGDTVRPGILVLINDTDWEICGGADSEINDGDRVAIISTLHGG